MTTFATYFCAYVVVIIASQKPCLAKRNTTLATDQISLLEIKLHTNVSNPNRVLESNWTNSSPICSWIGVTCGSRHHRVTALNISNMNLSGNLPPQIGSLSFLISLDLSHNHFSGSLIQELSFLSRLKHLSLSNNSLTGLIPKSLSNLSNLQYLDLSENSLHGEVPFELGRLHNLKDILMQRNRLSGVIPSSIFNISKLRRVELNSNELSGGLPIDMCRNLPFIQELYLGFNNLTGNIPSNLSQCSKLKSLGLGFNNFNGGIPREIGQLHHLEVLMLKVNSLSGTLPTELFNVSTLRILGLGDNLLSGDLPSNMFNRLHNLEWLYISNTSLTGSIPRSISNCTSLRFIHLFGNKFTGFVPSHLGKLRFLTSLLIDGNNLMSESLSFITSLTNCSSLTKLRLSDNPLGGRIPYSIGRLSPSLDTLLMSNTNIRGSIPSGIGNLTNLVILDLSGNNLSGSIPFTIKNLHKLQGLNLHNNIMHGSIQEGLCELSDLVQISLGQNQFSSFVPKCLGNVTSLQNLLLGSNKLNSSIPSSLWHLKRLLKLDLSSNLLSGFLPPEIGNLKAAIHINLQMNQLSGSIPSTIGNLQNLIYLSLSCNKLSGPFPLSIGEMISLVTLDLSNNNLSGSIPKSLETLKYLLHLNVSFNDLSGEILTNGPFINFTLESFKGNKALCGIPRFHVPVCPIITSHESEKNKIAYVVGGGFLCVFGVLVFFAFICMRYKRRRKANAMINELTVSTLPERVSYYEILEATHKFNESNLLGFGSFSHVYKGVLKNGKAIAVKVFDLQVEASLRSFEVECEVLRNIRHRNLIKVITSCSNEDFKALVLEYMPNKSLEKWLYSHNYCLDLMQRLNIMIHVACGLEYLHHGYIARIVHGDLKPSNILLDEEMTAHVSDFGIAKVLGQDESVILTNTISTIGYIAPEYGLEGLVSTRCDVYSYGVVLMETFTRRKPSDDMFSGDLSLKRWVEGLLVESPNHVIDANLLINVEVQELDKNVRCVSSILELGLKCCTEIPRDRINMKEVVTELKKIKLGLCRNSF